MNKKRILQNNIYHHKAITKISLIFTNTHKLTVFASVSLASVIPPAIMDYDEDGDLVMTSQLQQQIDGMAVAYKLGYSMGVEDTTKEIHKHLDHLLSI